MQITSKGQVTIPKVLRDKFGFMPHTGVDFVEEHGRVVVKKMKRGTRTKAGSLSHGAKIVRRLTGKGRWKMTTDEIMALTRGE